MINDFQEGFVFYEYFFCLDNIVSTANACQQLIFWWFVFDSHGDILFFQ